MLGNRKRRNKDLQRLAFQHIAVHCAELCVRSRKGESTGEGRVAIWSVESFVARMLKVAQRGSRVGWKTRRAIQIGLLKRLITAITSTH